MKNLRLFLTLKNCNLNKWENSGSNAASKSVVVICWSKYMTLQSETSQLLLFGSFAKTFKIVEFCFCFNQLWFYN